MNAQRSETASIAELIAARASDTSTGLLFEDERFTWNQVVDASLAHGALLNAQLGTAQHRHVGVLLENTPEYFFILGGAALYGFTVVGINPTRRGAELRRDIEHTDCQLLVVDDAYRDRVPDDLSVPVVDLGTHGWGDEVARFAGASMPDTLPQGDTRFVLVFTSGSTSAPKAVSLSSVRIGTAAISMRRTYELTPQSVCYLHMPMFHGNALIACWAAGIAAGAAIAMRRRFSASGFLDDVRKFGCTYFTYVGRTISYVLAQPPTEHDRDHELVVGFGTEASAADRERFETRFGCPLVESYGSSESAIVIVRTPETPPGALGVARPGTEADIAIMNPETSTPCAPAEFDHHHRLTNPTEAIGELVNLAGGGPFTGYYNNPGATANRFRNGWYWSGDLAFRDQQGFFWFAGRSDDWLRVDSENLGAEPIATVLARWDKASAVTVYAVPDPVTGDQVMAAVQLVAGAEFEANTFSAFLTSQADLGDKWAPRFVRIVSELPVTANNKTNKQRLRADGFLCSDPVWWSPARDEPYRLLDDAGLDALRDQFVANQRSHYLPSN